MAPAARHLSANAENPGFSQDPPHLLWDSGRRFEVRNVWCVGRNYAAHAREMGAVPEQEPPLFFAKPASALQSDPGQVPYPPATSELHHEVELVLALGNGGTVAGATVGVDLTRRCVQRAAKAAGKPWALAKGFDHSGPCARLVQVSDDSLAGARIWLRVNGKLRQDADLAQMLWAPTEILRALSAEVELHAGDVVFTGTPAGVGPLLAGDRVEAGIDGLAQLSFFVGSGDR